MPISSLPNPQPPHPYGPFAAVEDVHDSDFLMRVLTESAVAAAASAHDAGVDPAALPVTCITDRLRVAWECAPAGGRRDALLSCAERAARVGVNVGVGTFAGDTDRLPPVEAIAYLIQGVLLAYVREDLATASTADGPNLLPAAPWCPPVNASGRFASATVDDFDQPEDAKMLVCVRLLAASR
ncbi:hypothetical protein [Virgisporangium aurantiacum]|uniref:Uncharacterized protein n=1 Tax=Virgisporangium aurantiacum TaxID=175570 RepID=A0A8J4E4N7_9ACTN|nr:hypothetical protein [Virgisporangium aurantiacum]GIJ61243.1 hypothetical protein Vau01_087590 [Virgisporangium aurantiacum]